MDRYRIDRGSEHVIGLEKDDKYARWAKRKDYDPRKYKRFALNIPTPDDWCPTLEDGTVEVAVIRLNCIMPGDKPAIRTMVWGGDDMGLERDETFETWEEAEEVYLRRVREVSGWGIVTFKMLTDLGFGYS